MRKAIEHCRREVIRIEHFYEKDIKRIAFWGKFVGGVIIVYGLLITIQELATSIVGVIPGVLAFLVGRSLYYSAAHAKEYIDSGGEKVIVIDDILKFIGRSFMLIGIIMFIFIVFYGLYLMIT